MKKDKFVFLEQLTDLLIQDHHITPLAAKTYALLITADQVYCTFDELVKLTTAGNSSVSNQLNNLLQSKKITFETRTNFRKCYFKINQNYINDTL